MPMYGRMVGMKSKRPLKIPALDSLQKWPVSELRRLYEELHNKPPPPRTYADFLRSNIAWTLQASDQSKSPAALRQALIKRINGRTPRATNTDQAGTRLIREWQGQTYEVAVLDSGYLWQGEHYRSLSRIAREITGTGWSGPRFFGLKGTTNG